MLRAIVLLIVALSLAVPTHPQAISAQGGAPALLASVTPPDSVYVKYPRAAAFGNRVYLGGSANDTATVWTKVDSAASFDNVLNVGSASRGRSGADYANTAVATGPDGSVYTAWINQGVGIFMRRRLPNGSFEPQKTVATGSAFRAFVDIGVTTNGTIIVTWDDGAGEARHLYTVSRNGGNSWSGPQALIDEKAGKIAAHVETGPNNSAVITHYTATDYSIYAAIWDGNTFNNTLVTRGSRSNAQADPTAAISGDGSIYVAWRSVVGGVFYAKRQGNGWTSPTKLAEGGVPGTVAIAADSQNNLHMGWVSDVSGGYDFYYAYKAADGNWQGPLRLPGQAKILANSAIEATLSDNKAYGHFVAERFVGDTMINHYLLYATDAIVINANPRLDNNADFTKNESVTLTFSNTSGDPKEVRWNWGTPPTDADNDSGGWKAYASTMTVPIPSDIEDEDCRTINLYTQVKNGSAVQTSNKSDAITYDASVQAYARTNNPHMSRTMAKYSQGAYEGASNYTRSANYILSIANIGDCAGVNTYSINGGEAKAYPTTGGDITQTLTGKPWPPRVVEFPVVITDKNNNSRTFNQSIVYDPMSTVDPALGQANTDGAPVLSTGTVTDTTATNSILRTFTFTDVVVTDNMYGKLENLPAGKQFWGVWIAASKGSPVDDPNSDTLQWTAVRVANPGPNFSVNYSLATNQSAIRTTGQEGRYYVYVKVLDGAGNPSSKTMSMVVDLKPGYSLINTPLPMLVRK